jgi:CheY-like chemotaxis protein
MPPATRKNRILFIDDDSDDNFFHALAISRSGIECEVDTFESSMTALEHLRGMGEDSDSEARSPDLIFLDINMPRMDGWQFLAEYDALAESGQMKAKPVIIMLSNSANPADHASPDIASDDC